MKRTKLFISIGTLTIILIAMFIADVGGLGSNVVAAVLPIAEANSVPVNGAVNIANTPTALEQKKMVLRGYGADASFSSWNDCGYGDAWLFVQKNITMSGGPPQSLINGNIRFSQWNWCTNENSNGQVELQNASFSGNGIQGSHLSFKGVGYVEKFLGCERTVCGCTGTTWCEECRNDGCVYCECPGDGQCYSTICRWDYGEVPVAIDLTWTPTDEVSRGMNSGTYRFADGMSRYRYSGSSAVCTVDGSFVVDGLDYATEVADSYGNSWQSVSGQIDIIRFPK